MTFVLSICILCLLSYNHNIIYLKWENVTVKGLTVKNQVMQGSFLIQDSAAAEPSRKLKKGNTYKVPFGDIFRIVCLCISASHILRWSGPGCNPETSQLPSEDCLPPLSCSQITLGKLDPVRRPQASLSKDGTCILEFSRIKWNSIVCSMFLSSVVCSMIAAVLMHKLHLLSCELPCPYYIFSIAVILFRTCVFCCNAGSRLQSLGVW